MTDQPPQNYSELLKYLSVPSIAKPGSQLDELLQKLNAAQQQHEWLKNGAGPQALPRTWEFGLDLSRKQLEQLADSLIVKPTPSPEPLPTVTLRFAAQQSGTTLATMEDLTLEVGAQVTIQGYGPENADLNIKVIAINLPEPRKSMDQPETKFDLPGVSGHFSYQAPATTCVMADRSGRIATSLARCHPDDVYDAPTGRKLAFGRALKHLFDSPYVRVGIWRDYFSVFPLDRAPRKDRS